MIITDEWISEHGPCLLALDWWDKKERDAIVLLRRLFEQEHYSWANWLIVRVMTRPQNLAYAIFAAEQVIEIYERKYAGDNRPRAAIEAAKKVMEDDTPENRAAAYAAADAAVYAAYAAVDAAARAAYAAAYAADAAYAAADAVYAAYAAADAVYAADAARAAYAADAAMYKKILEYGIGMLEKVT